MTKILIFTSSDALFFTDYCDAVRPCPKEGNPIVIVKIDSKSSFNFVNDIKDEGVYLIYDEIEKATLEMLSTQCRNDEVYALVHERTLNKDTIQEITGIDRCRMGHHLSGDQYIYYPVFDILTDNEDNKEGRIIRLLSPLKAKELLNTAIKFFGACMTPGNDYIITDTGVEKFLNDPEFGNEIINFYNNHYKNGDAFREYKDYFDSLKAVSDKVLAIIVDRVKKEKLCRKEGK